MNAKERLLPFILGIAGGARHYEVEDRKMQTQARNLPRSLAIRFPVPFSCGLSSCQ
jgi:hypothetical protein